MATYAITLSSLTSPQRASGHSISARRSVWSNDQNRYKRNGIRCLPCQNHHDEWDVCFAATGYPPLIIHPKKLRRMFCSASYFNEIDMVIRYVLVFIIFLPGLIFGQKHDYYWLMGQDS